MEKRNRYKNRIGGFVILRLFLAGGLLCWTTVSLFSGLLAGFTHQITSLNSMNIHCVEFMVSTVQLDK